MKKFLQIASILTLLIWGVFFLYFYFGGRISRYLDPSFHIYVLLAGIGFLILAGFNFFARNHALDACTHEHGHEHEHEDTHQHEGGCCHHDDHDHDHDDACCHHHHHTHHHDRVDDCCHSHAHTHDHSDHALQHHHEENPSNLAFALIVLLAPLFLAASYTQDRFSSEYVAKWDKIERQMRQLRIAANRKNTPVSASVTSASTPSSTDDSTSSPTASADGTSGSKTTDNSGESWNSFSYDDLKKLVPQNEQGEFLLDIPQIFYTAGDQELMKVMEGIPVESTAQLMEEAQHNADSTRLKAFRLFVECCAADARPLSVPIDFGKAPPEYTEMGWYKLFGKLHFSHEGDEIIPIIRVNRIEATTEPAGDTPF